MAETWKQYMQRMRDTYSHLPNYITNVPPSPKGTPYCDVCRCFRPLGQCGYESYGQKRPDNCPRSKTD